MASFIFQRAPWRLQISRSQRTFSISFSTALPQRSRPSPLLQETYDNSSSHSSHRHHHEQASRRHQHRHRPSTAYQQARTAFTSTHSRRAQESSSQPSTTEPPPPQSDLTLGLSDQPVILDEGERQVDWTRSFHGLSAEPFSKEARDILTEPIEPMDVEIKSEGILYLPEIKYRRILNRAFGPGGWGLAPRGETIVTAKAVTREYALVALGRYVYIPLSFHHLHTYFCSLFHVYVYLFLSTTQLPTRMTYPSC